MLAGVLVLFLFAGTSDGIPPVPHPAPGPPAGPLAIVSMGDSTMSGEGGGAYDVHTDGANGDWCHRSANAEIKNTVVPGVTYRLNLACSGAASAQVGLGKTVHYNEISQSTQLASIARKYRITAIVVGVGANDEPRFSDTLSACVQAWFDSNRPGCSANFTTVWQRRINLMEPKVVAALRDIRTVMAGAGYQTGSYQLVLQSYAAPVGPDVARGYQNLNGCPLRTTDLQWVRTTGVTMLDDGLEHAAVLAGTRFLDLHDAGIGHEACSGGDNAGNEWFTRLTVAWRDLQSDARATHALQESFHPNARGYVAFGRCLAQFLSTNEPAAACLPGTDGTLRPAAIISSG